MLLTNFDLYDLHAVFVRLRFDPKCPHNLAIATAIKQLLDTPNTSNTVECNAVRKALSPISSLDRENWYWVFTENIYTYGVEFVKHDTVYRILRLIFDEFYIVWSATGLHSWKP